MEGLDKSASKEIIPENDNGSEKKEKQISTIEINGIKIETQKEYFEYPEYIQKETGILGYDRTIIKKEDAEKIGDKELDIALSGGKFPSFTFNHQLGADIPIEQKQAYHTYFKNDKFFLQKIFDIDRLNKSFKEKELGIPTKDRFRYYKKSDNNFIGKSGNVGATSLIETFKTNSNKEEVYAVGPDGLNTKYGEMWSDESGFMTSFGFTPEDPLYYEYLTKILEQYKKLYQEDPNTYFHSITNIIAQMIMRDEHLRHLWEIRDEKNRYFLSKESLESADLNLEQYVNEKINQLFKSFKINFITDENADKYIRQKYSLPERYRMNVAKQIIHEIYQPDLPIIINHNEIFQLSWGHAKYAHFMSSKGFNFIEFKHTDHLPQKDKTD